LLALRGFSVDGNGDVLVLAGRQELLQANH